MARFRVVWRVGLLREILGREPRRRCVSRSGPPLANAVLGLAAAQSCASSGGLAGHRLADLGDLHDLVEDLAEALEEQVELALGVAERGSEAEDVVAEGAE